MGLIDSETTVGTQDCLSSMSIGDFAWAEEGNEAHAPENMRKRCKIVMDALQTDVAGLRQQLQLPQVASGFGSSSLLGGAGSFRSSTGSLTSGLPGTSSQPADVRQLWQMVTKVGFVALLLTPLLWLGASAADCCSSQWEPM